MFDDSSPHVLCATAALHGGLEHTDRELALRPLGSPHFRFEPLVSSTFRCGYVEDSFFQRLGETALDTAENQTLLCGGSSEMAMRTS